MLGLSEELGIPETDLLQAIEDRLGLLEIAPGIREDEYRNFMKGQNPAIGSEVDFQIEPAGIPDRFKGSLAKLVKAKRLREVRVLRGFTRLEPYAGPEDDPRIAPIGARPLGWLPGIEIRGEGIFFALDPAALRAWETTRRVRDRVATLSARVPTDRKINTEEATPRTILLHTLSHLLMSELALECGYSQASLRERIYVSEDEMAGALVYTGTPDSEGTLGGLVRQGDPERFAEIMLASLQRASWCANDPLCIEGTTTLSDVLNLAACHSCCLVPETSCEKFNRLLDRGLLIGTPSDPQIGFFQRLL